MIKSPQKKRSERALFQTALVFTMRRLLFLRGHRKVEMGAVRAFRRTDACAIKRIGDGAFHEQDRALSLANNLVSVLFFINGESELPGFVWHEPQALLLVNAVVIQYLGEKVDGFLSDREHKYLQKLFACSYGKGRVKFHFVRNHEQKTGKKRKADVSREYLNGFVAREHLIL